MPIAIQALWDYGRTFRDTYKIRDLFEREYGLTEFHIGDHNECLVFVGERTANINKSN